EVRARTDFKPIAKDIEANYSLSEKEPEGAEGNVESFVRYFNNRLERLRKIICDRGPGLGMVQDINSIKKMSDGKELSVVGIVRGKHITKNKNMLVEIEDESGKVPAIFINSMNKQMRELYADASSLVNDEVVALSGKRSGDLLIANKILWPDVPIKNVKNTEDDIAIAFISDIHMGSRLFMEKSFNKMISWLNGNVEDEREIAGKVKYIVIAGDDVDGIGVYPGQERDLAVLDVYAQYRMLFDYLEMIPDYIQIFLLPGNHDAVQRAEPQPRIPDELADFKMENVHLLSSPAMIKMHDIEVLAY
ncbi:DNA polymerase II small subunit, partial [mine drainage metagenome]